MPAMRQAQKEANKAAATLEGWFAGYDDGELLYIIRDYCKSENIRHEIIDCLNKLNVGNCGYGDYELAERIENTLYRLEYGVFWKLIAPGKYLLDRKSAFNMRAIVDHKPIPFPNWQAVEQLRAADAAPRVGSEN